MHHQRHRATLIDAGAMASPDFFCDFLVDRVIAEEYHPANINKAVDEHISSRPLGERPSPLEGTPPMPVPLLHRWVRQLFFRWFRRSGTIRRKATPQRRLLAVEQLERLEPTNLLVNPLALPFDVSQVRLVDDRALQESSAPDTRVLTVTSEDVHNAPSLDTWTASSAPETAGGGSSSAALDSTPMQPSPNASINANDSFFQNFQGAAELFSDPVGGGASTGGATSTTGTSASTAGDVLAPSSAGGSTASGASVSAKAGSLTSSSSSSSDLLTQLVMNGAGTASRSGAIQPVRLAAPVAGVSPKTAPQTGGGLAASGASVHFVEGGPATYLQVATITDGDGTKSFNAYTASIDWGDGQVTNGVVTGSNGSFQVLGSHSYAEEGTFTITVSINDSDGATVAAKSTAAVADAALSVSGNSVTVAAQPGVELNAAVAYFTDADPAGELGDYSATIKWGDKTSSSGTIGQAGPEGSQNYAVVGSHTYAKAGTYLVTILINDVGGSTLTVNATVNVASSITNGPSGSLSATGKTFTPTEGQSIAGVTVATFTDSDGNQSASAYSASINWGDGNVTAGSITGPVNGVFSVVSPKTYAEEGTYTTTITITDTDGASAMTNGMAIVSDAALQSGTSIHVTAQATVPFYNASLVTFSDMDPVPLPEMPVPLAA
jgi:hypothetical protein